MKIPVEVKETLNTFGSDIKSLVNIKPQQFDIVTIATMVRSTPERKWNAAQSVVNNTILKKSMEQKYKTLKAQKMMLAKNNETLKAAPDRTAWVENQEDVQQAEIALINADAELQAAKLGYECLDDLFTAGKKIMDYLVEQEKATQQYNRFVDEGRKSR